MNIIQTLETTGNTALALKVSQYLLNVYQLALDGCVDEAEKAELKVVFSEALRSER